MFNELTEFHIMQRQKKVIHKKKKSLSTSGIMSIIIAVLLFASSAAWADNSFTVVDIKPDTPTTTKIAIQSLAGLYNRQKGGSVYTRMSDKDSQWLYELDLTPAKTVNGSSFLEQGLKDFPRCVRYSYNNQRILLPNILTVASVLHAVPLDEQMGIACATVAFDAIAEFQHRNSPYHATAYVYDNYVNETTGLAMLNPGYDIHDFKVWDPELSRDAEISMIDFVFSERLFVVFLVNGCIGLSNEHSLLNEIASYNPWKKPIGVYGYNNSWMVFGGYVFEAQTACIKARNMGAIPTETNNLSFFSTRRDPITSPGEIEQNALEDIRFDPNKTYVAFVVGDGDNVSFIMDARRRWLRERLDECQKTDNSCPPITWTISPHLPDIAPDIIKWYYDRSRETGNDYFMLPPSGYHYAYPSALSGPMQNEFVKYTEDAANLLGTQSTMHWEWFNAWVGAERNFLPKYAKQNGPIKGLFPVNVPFMFPTFTWRPNQYHKIIRGRDGGEAVLFVPRSWRGVNNSGNFITKKYFLSPDKMAAELGGYPRGTVAYVYMTSDGGLNLTNSFIALSKIIPGHVRLVSADTASRLALEAYHNNWGNPVSFKTAHGKYLVAENNGGKTVNANRSHIGPWERFHLIANEGLKDRSQITIQTGNGHYFSAQPNGALDANRTAVAPWEKFTLINHSSPGGLLKHGHVVSLKGAHNQYVVAEDKGGANANRGAIGRWEKFTVLFHKNIEPPNIPPPTDGTKLVANQGLTPGMSLSSHDKRFRLDMQSDGNLVMYQGGSALWSSNTQGRHVAGVIMQGDGNLVIYEPNGRPIWASNTHGNPGAYLSLQDDGNLVIYSASNKPLWTSNTCCR